ncbi:MAG: LamG-like jellyroll fold domain-containing protein [Armatimonadota bacterium]
MMLSVRSMVAALCAGAALVSARAAEPTRLDHQTFYASFDDGLKADSAVGLAWPLASGDTATDTPGHSGNALRYAQGGGHSRLSYDCPGNIHPSRGSCSLWFMPDSEEDNRPYCRPVLIGVATSVEGYWGCLMKWGPRHISGETPISRCYASIYEGSHGLHMVSHKIEGLWRKGQWRHLVWVWDSRMGMKVYDNGELVADQWGPAHGWAEVPDCPARQFCIGMYGRDFRGGGRPGYLIDEVRIFDAALDEKAVRALYADRFDAPITLEPIPTEAMTRTLTRMGWVGTDRQSLIPLALGGAGDTSTRIRVNAIDEAVDARRPLSHLSDGLPTSGWRHATYGASSSGRVVELKLREPGQFNHVEVDVFHQFTGRLLGMRAETDLVVPSDRMHWRRSLPEPVTASTLRIERDEGRIAEVRLWKLMPSADSPPADRVFRAAGPLDTPEIHRSLAGRMARQSLAEKPRGWVLAEGAGGRPGPLALEPLTPAFFISAPILTDLPAGAVTFRISVAEAPPQAAVRIELRDPIWPTRRLFQGDFRLEGGRSGTAALYVDLPDFFVGGRPADEPYPEEGGKAVAQWHAGEPLRLMSVLTASGRLVVKQVDLLVHETERAKAIAEHDREQLPYIREGYADTSEARAYGWHPLAYEKLFFPLHDFNRREPDRPEVKAIATRVGMRREPLQVEMPQATAGVPRWASLQLDVLKRCRVLCHYWIDERELPNGEVGGGLGDDTDFKDDWVNLALISDDDGKIADSIRRLADTAWTREGMDRGYQIWMRDALHAIEEGADLQPHLLHLYPGNPQHVERVMQMCQHLWEWMDVVPSTGKLHFKSWYVGGKGKFRTDFSYGQDRDVCGYFTMGPAFFVWATGHPRVAERLVRWCDSWLSYLDERDEDGEPLGFPSAIEWQTGRPVGERRDLAGGDPPPLLLMPAFVCAYHWTGDEKYLALHRLSLRGMARTPYPRFGAWVNELARLGSEEDRELIEQIAVKHAFSDPAAAPSIQRDPHTVRSQFLPHYSAWKMTGDKAYLEIALASALTFLDEQFPAITWALPSTDRIPQPRETLDCMYLGGLATCRPGMRPPYPEHAVSYKGIGEEVAALVTAHRPDHLRIVFFNTDAAERELTVRLWQIESGRFTLTQGPDENQDDQIDAGRAVEEERELTPGDSVRVVLPPRSGYVVDVSLEQAAPRPTARPDLAVCPDDIQTDPNAGHANVVLHNIGLAPAEDVLIRLVDATTGEALVEQTIPRLEAPLDLEPRFARLQFVNVDTAPHGRVRVLVDPENNVAERDERNNTVEFSF